MGEGRNHLWHHLLNFPYHGPWKLPYHLPSRDLSTPLYRLPWSLLLWNHLCL